MTASWEWGADAVLSPQVDESLSYLLLRHEIWYILSGQESLCHRQIYLGHKYSFVTKRYRIIFSTLLKPRKDSGLSEKALMNPVLWGWRVDDFLWMLANTLLTCRKRRRMNASEEVSETLFCKISVHSLWICSCLWAFGIRKPETRWVGTLLFNRSTTNTRAETNTTPPWRYTSVLWAQR